MWREGGSEGESDEGKAFQNAHGNEMQIRTCTYVYTLF